MQLIAALIAGAVFGAGLVVSGMSNPMKVLNFLDLAAIQSGRWDPTLLAVFAGALPVMFAAYRLSGNRPILAERFDIPAGQAVDPPLILGSALFGVGWGMVGLCPGPAVVAVALAAAPTFPATIVFLSAMLAGVWLAMITRTFWQSGQTSKVLV